VPDRRVRVDAAGPHLDFELIAERPKAFCGYSDITALHVALRQRAGLATFYGPHLLTMGWTEASDFTRDRLLAVLEGDGTGPVPADPDDPDVRPIRGGRASGPLAGGDLARCDWSEQRPEWPRTKSLEQVLEEHLEPLGVPVLYRLPIGHAKHLATLPLGVAATLGSDARTLVIEQSALR
jgi:muramoyltetrapeptide carboxypeptidase